MIDADKLFREAVDEPAPPPPAEPFEDEDGGDDGHGHLCRPPSLVVYADGGLATSSASGTLLVAVWTLGVAAIAYLVCSWLWAVLTLQALLIVGWVAFGIAWAVAAVIGLLMWREKRRGRR